jgi:uncharacterized membrane protein
MKTKTSATLMLLLTFLLGSIAGALSYHLYRGRIAATGPRAGSRPSQREVIKEMGKDLSLDAAQQEKLAGIMKLSREKYRALSEQVRPQFDQIRNQTHAEIRQILRDDQKARFEERLKEFDRRHRNRPYRPDAK